MVVRQYAYHILGARDSPTCANYALQKTANDNMSRYPEAASVVAEKFRLDDYLDSFTSIEQAVTICRDLVKLLKIGGFVLTKFVSNIEETTFAKNSDVNETTLLVKETSRVEQSLHVLALKWDHVKDTLVVSRGVDCPLDKVITQRTVLSFVSSVFEPFGLVAPYIVMARL